MANVRVASVNSDLPCVPKSDGNVEGRSDGSDNSSGSTFSDVLTPATTYIMAPRLVQMFVPPSPQYLTAVYRTLTKNFPELSDRPIEVCDYTGETPRDELATGMLFNLPCLACKNQTCRTAEKWMSYITLRARS